MKICDVHFTLTHILNRTLSVLGKRRRYVLLDLPVLSPTSGRGGGGLVALTVRGVSAEWLRAGVPPLLRGADGSPQSTPEGFPPEKGSAQWT